MRKGDSKLFNDRNRLYSLINQRRNGFSTYTLAILHSCDRTSVEEQCEKFGVYPLTDEIFGIERVVRKAIPINAKGDLEPKWRVLSDGERINRGKDYADYLKERNMRISPYK